MLLGELWRGDGSPPVYDEHLTIQFRENEELLTMRRVTSGECEEAAIVLEGLGGGVEGRGILNLLEITKAPETECVIVNSNL